MDKYYYSRYSIRFFCMLAITIVLFVVVQSVFYYPVEVLGVIGLLSVAGGIFLFGIGLYRQFLAFLALLQFFTLAVKVGYGAVNTALLALLPSVFVAFMAVQAFILVGENKTRLRLSLVDLGVVAFFCLDLINVFNPYLDITRGQPFLSIGLRGFQQRSFLGLTYFVARVVIYNEYRLQKVFRVLAYSVALSSLYAIMQQFFGFTLLESRHRQALVVGNLLARGLYAKRAVGFLGSPFSFGLVSAMGMLCSIYLLISVRLSSPERFLVFGSLFLNGFAVLLSGSRSTYLALIVTVVLVLPGVPWRRLLMSMWRARRVILVILVVGAVILLSDKSMFLLQFSLQRFVSLRNLDELLFKPREITDINFAVRRELATATWPLIMDNPFGYGTGIFNGGSNPHGLVTVKGYATWVDNEFSSLALEIGLLGVFLLLYIVVFAVWRCRRAARIRAERDWAFTLLALVVICPIAGFGGQWLSAYPANVLFWIFCGIAANLPLRTLSGSALGSAQY